MAFYSLVVGFEPKVQLAKDCLLAFADGWLADPESTGNLAFGVLVPKQAEEEFSVPWRQSAERLAQGVASQKPIEAGDGTRGAAFPALRHFVIFPVGQAERGGRHPLWKAVASEGPFLAIAGEDRRHNALINEGGNGYALGRIEINFGLATSGGTNGPGLFEPVEGRPIRGHTPGANALEAAPHDEAPVRGCQCDRAGSDGPWTAVGGSGAIGKEASGTDNLAVAAAMAVDFSVHRRKSHCACGLPTGGRRIVRIPLS